MGGGGGDLAHATRLGEETATTRGEGSGNRGSAPGLMCPASCVVDIFPVENAGKRAAIPRLMGF